MLLFAHTGITLASARSLEKVIVWRGMKRFAELIDYRLVLLGSMLPDIIDKPLGGLVFREGLGNGRIYGHTLLFLLFLVGTGIFFWFRYRKSWPLVLAGSVFFHYILDFMWLLPQTFLWPFYGWAFPKGNPEGWFWQWIENLITNPYVYVPEIIGAVIMVSFVIELIIRKKLQEFITTGRLFKVLP